MRRTGFNALGKVFADDIDRCVVGKWTSVDDTVNRGCRTFTLVKIRPSPLSTASLSRAPPPAELIVIVQQLHWKLYQCMADLSHANDLLNTNHRRSV